MGGIEVDPPALARTGQGLAEQGDALSAAAQTLAAGLAGSGQMCGNDKAGQAFALTYRQSGQGLFTAAEAAVNACHNLGYGIGVSASNYARSEAASHTGGAEPSVAPPAEPTTFSGPAMPNPFGPAIGEPALWSLVNEFIGSPWPDGNPATLHAAAGLWRTMGEAVSAITAPVGAASSVVAAQQMPETGAIVAHLSDMATGLGDLATQCQSMASTLDSFAEEVNSAQEAIRDLLHRLSISGILEELGSIFTGHDPWEDVRQVAEDIKVILHTMQREADGAEAMFQTMMAELDSATNGFEAWARKEFTHFLGEDVGNAVADAFIYQVDVDAGLLESLLYTVDGLQQVATNPREWEALAMNNPATQITEFAKDPKAFLDTKVEALKQLGHVDEITGDHPVRGIAHLTGDIAQLFIPGAGEAKAAAEGTGAARAESSAIRAEGAAAGKVTEALAGAAHTDIATQGSKLTNDFNKIADAKAPVKAADAVPSIKEPGGRPVDPGGKAPAGAAGPAGAERAPVEARTHRAEPVQNSPIKESAAPSVGSTPRPDADRTHVGSGENGEVPAHNSLEPKAAEFSPVHQDHGAGTDHPTVADSGIGSSAPDEIRHAAPVEGRDYGLTPENAFRVLHDPAVEINRLVEGGVPRNLTEGYDPLGGRTIKDFQDEFTIRGEDGSLRWDWDGQAPNHGFAGIPTATDRIPEGYALDRCGSENGAFLTQGGDPLSTRGMPPGIPSDYYQYVGTGENVPPGLPWEVRYGPAKEAFAQQGGANQWVVINTEKDKPVPVRELIENGLIKRQPKP